RCEMQIFILSLLALAAAMFLRAEAADNTDGPATPGETKRVRWASAPPVKQNTYRIQRMKDNPTINADWNKAAWRGVTPVALEYYMGEEPAAAGQGGRRSRWTSCRDPSTTTRYGPTSAPPGTSRSASCPSPAGRKGECRASDGGGPRAVGRRAC